MAHEKYVVPGVTSLGTATLAGYPTGEESGRATKFVPLDSVGLVYQFGINGRGLMLSAAGEGDAVQRQVASLDVQRLVTSETPLAEAVDRYNFDGVTDGRSGAGQELAHRPDSEPNRYWDSMNADPFTIPGQISAIPWLGTYGWATAVVGAAIHYVAPVTPAGAVIILQTPADTARARWAADLLNDRQIQTRNLRVTPAVDAGRPAVHHENVYIARTDGVTLVDTGNAATPSETDWVSATKPRHLHWANGRLCGIADKSDGRPAFWSWAAGTGGAVAAEETGGHYTAPSDASTMLVAGSHAGRVLFTVDDSLWYWDTSPDPDGSLRAPAELFRLGGGETIVSADVLAGSVWFVADAAGQRTYYRGVLDTSGGLTIVVQAIVSSDTILGGLPAGTDVQFAHRQNDIYMTYSSGRNTVGILRYYLPTGGWCKHTETGGLTGTRIGVFISAGRLGHFGQNFTFLFAEESRPQYAREATVRASLIDGGSTLYKGWDELRGVLKGECPAGCSVEARWSTTGAIEAAEWSELVPTGKVTGTLPINAQPSATLVAEYRLLTNGESTPEVIAFLCKYHAQGARDEVLRVTVDCADYLSSLTGNPTPDSGRGSGGERLAWLRSLAQSSVEIQDVDWQERPEVKIYDLLTIDEETVTLHSRRLGRQETRTLATLTLRRSLEEADR